MWSSLYVGICLAITLTNLSAVLLQIIWELFEKFSDNAWRHLDSQIYGAAGYEGCELQQETPRYHLLLRKFLHRINVQSAVTLASGRLLVSTRYLSPCTLEVSPVHFFALKFFYSPGVMAATERLNVYCTLSTHSLCPSKLLLILYFCVTLKKKKIINNCSGYCVCKTRRFATHACSERCRSWSLRVKYLLGGVAIVSVNVANMLTVESVQHKETLICCHTEAVSLCINNCVVHFKSHHTWMPWRDNKEESNKTTGKIFFFVV